MASAFRQYRQSIVPTTHQRPNGAAFQGLLGDVNDTLVDRAKQAVKARFPLLAPSDALDAIGLERSMPRGPSESDAVYAQRLVGAWNAWPWAGTPFGLLQQLWAGGYTSVLLCQVVGGIQYALDATGSTLVRTTSGSWTCTYVGDPFWSRFDVLFPAPLPASWQSGGVPSSGSNEANFIRGLIRTWKPGFATCNRIVIVTAGNILGYPTTRVLGSAAGNLGGATTVVWSP